MLQRLNRKIKQDGVQAVLKKGLSIDHAHMTLFYRLPYNQLNPDVIARFGQNRFSLTRQVHYSATDTGKSIDTVLFINGLALASM